jgi:nucleotide-binding universal stress UspA family protein
MLILGVASRYDITSFEIREGGAMYKTILVPLDGSKRAENILRHVEALARCYNATVIFIQVLKPPTRADYAMPHPEIYERQLNDQLRDAKNYLDGHKLQFMKKNIESKTQAVFGSVVKEILRVAEQEKADLIAICSHGRGGLSRLFYGSVAAGVLNRADRPLLIIRARSAIE